jgi:hypothetical protein
MMSWRSWPFPREVWGNNPWERLNKKVRRRTDVVGIFPVSRWTFHTHLQDVASYWWARLLVLATTWLGGRAASSFRLSSIEQRRYIMRVALVAPGNPARVGHITDRVSRRM